MQKDRQSLYILGTRRKIKVNLEIKEGNTFVEPRSTAPPFHWPPLQLPMPDCNRPEGVSGKWRESRANDISKRTKF